ncbi:phage tail tape measure protein [Paraburkholderia caribensis]|uniref:phage tail tape measure protein n=1 Tax=Paraburkholderia caribensis TaxID=75105 RepID=UPI001CB56FDF|nr:phage tail tape measure protein [Paraburkholderia caribensis]CAG9262223.1 Phage tape measure protein [Paraburkholderia caribensis]
MVNEVITRVSVDASGFEAGMERTRRASKSFVADQEATARKFDSSQQTMGASGTLVARALEEASRRSSAATARQVNAAVRQFEKMADTAGKTRIDLLRMKAANLGIAGTMEPLIARIEAGSQAMHHFGAGSAAARRELFVLAHEAIQGSWKNFAGSLMVMGERLDLLPLLCGPAGAALGALGASAFVAWREIHELTLQQEELGRTLTLTGNYAALTQGKLLAYAETTSREVGVSTGEARQALLELAKSGLVAGADLARLGESVSAYAKVSGQSVKDVVHHFVQSYEKAASAAEKWAETHHDLTRAQIDHIRLLEQSGDKAGAWAQFVQDATQAARRAVVANNGVMAQSYETLGQKWERFWRQASGKADELTKLQDEIASRRSMLSDGDSNPFGVNTEAIEREIAQLERRRNALLEKEEKKDGHRKDVDRFESMIAHHDEQMMPMRTWKEQLYDANQRARVANDAILGAAKAAGKGGDELVKLHAKLSEDLRKAIAHNEAKYHPKGSINREDEATRLLQRLRQQGSELQAQLASTQQLSAAEKELVKFDERIAGLKKHTADVIQKSLLDNEAAIHSQLRKNVALEKEVQLRAQESRLAERAQHTRENLDEYRREQKERYAQTLEGRHGDVAQREQIADLRGIRREHERLLNELKHSTANNLLNSDSYRQAVAEIKDSMDKALIAHEEYFAALKQRQDDWRQGMREGLADYFRDAQDKSAQASKAVVSTFGKMEDAIARFVTTGKFHMRELVSSILADLARLALHQTLGSVVQSVLAFLPGGHAQGGMIAGPGSTTSDSIPAMLSNGEFVVNAASTSKHRDLLEAINDGHVSHFASGGMVGQTGPMRSLAARSDVHLEVHHHGGGELKACDLQDLRMAVSAFVDQRVTQRMRGQGGGGYNQSLGLI